MCRKPWAIHKAEAEQCRAELGPDAGADDLNEAMADLYTAAAIFCPAEAAIDEARADLARTPAEKQAVERGRNPEAPRRWLAFTEADGPPVLPD